MGTQVTRRDGVPRPAHRPRCPRLPRAPHPHPASPVASACLAGGGLLRAGYDRAGGIRLGGRRLRWAALVWGSEVFWWELCPSRSWTTLMSAFPSSAGVADRCRVSCSRIGGSPDCSTDRLNRRLIQPGWSGSPFSWVRTQPLSAHAFSSPGHCRRFCSRITRHSAHSVRLRASSVAVRTLSCFVASPYIQ